MPVAKNLLKEFMNLGHAALPKAKPLFGADVADKAKQHGLRLGINTVLGDTADVSKVYNSALKHLGDKTKTFDVDWKNRQVINELTGKKFKGVVLDPTGSESARHSFKLHSDGINLVPSTSQHMQLDKLTEAQDLPGLIPRAVNVMDVIKGNQINLGRRNGARDLHSAVQKQLGSSNYIMKPIDGAAVTGSSFPTEAWDPAKMRKVLTRGVYSPSNKAYYGKGARKWMAQERIPLEQAGYVDRLANTAYGLATTKTNIPFTDKLKMFGNSLLGNKVEVPGVGSFAGNNMNEYRVHVVNGKVIPYGSMFRGGVLGALPWARNDSLLAEKAIQKQLDQLLPDKYRKGAFGFDVAKRRDGGWQVIETNPANHVDGSSGFLGNPQVVDAMRAAVMGQLPHYYRMQNRVSNAANMAGKLSLTGGAGYLGGTALASPFSSSPTV